MRIYNRKFSPAVSLPVLLASFLIAIFFIFTNSHRVLSELDDDIGGWAWDSFGGWISLNNCNPELGGSPSGCPAPNDIGYGLDISIVSDTEYHISGWTWSPGLGWICWGDSCTSGTPPSGSRTVIFDPTTADADGWADLSGWAKIQAWGEDGWISLNCSNHSGCAASSYKMQINVNDNRLKGWGWNGYLSGGSPYGLGWFCIGTGSDDPLDPCRYSSALGAVRYTKTTGGNVHSSGNISATLKPFAPDYNATFLIAADGTITNWTSEELDKEAGISSYILQSYGLGAELPSSANNYANIYGRLDIDGILNGDYGTVVTYSQSNISTAFGADELLEGKVHHFNNCPAGGSCLITSSLQFNKGYQQVFFLWTIDHPGDGLIYVDGDLTISADVTYQSGSVEQLNFLPSVAFIIRGDLIIDPSVENLVGTFIVLGEEGSTTCLAGEDHCGRVYTGDDSAVAEASKKTLTIKGLVIARDFKLQRTKQDIFQTPGEIIQYDGRVVLNTPPGLEDFSQILPAWQEISPP